MDSFDKQTFQTRCYSQQQEPQQRSFYRCLSYSPKLLEHLNFYPFIFFFFSLKPAFRGDRRPLGSSLTFPLRVHEEEMAARAAPRGVQQVELCLQPLDFLRRAQVRPNSERVKPGLPRGHLCAPRGHR